MDPLPLLDRPVSRGRRRPLWHGCLGPHPAVAARRRGPDGPIWWLGVAGSFAGPVRVERASGAMWLGDPAFDRHARVVGDGPAARAGLGERARVRVLRLLGLGARSVGWGRSGLVLRAPEGWGDEHARRARATVVELLAELPETGGTDEGLLCVALGDPEVRVRAGAAETLLGRLRESEPVAVARATAALVASSRVRPRHRLDALWVLETFAPEGAGAVLSGLLGVADPRIRRAVVTRLGASGCPETGEALARLAHDPDEGVAAAAVEALGALGLEVFEALVIERMFGGPPGVRLAAARALGRLGRGPAAGRALARVAGEPSEHASVRAAALASRRRLAEILPPAGSLGWPPLEEGGALSLTLDVDLDVEAGPEAEDEARGPDRRAWLFDQSI